jgi:hypothetical protein
MLHQEESSCNNFVLQDSYPVCMLVSMRKETKPAQPTRIVTAAQRLQFVVRFAQMDLDTLRPGDWLNLRDDLRAFFLGSWYKHDLGSDSLPPLAAGDVFVHPTARPFPEEYPEEEFRTLQSETYKILRQAIPLEGEMYGTPPPVVPQPVAIDGPISLTVPHLDGLIPAKGRHMLVAEGSTRDMFLLLTFLLLAKESTARIRRCPECDSLFYRAKTYCSRTCANRVATRKWRERQESAATS